MQGVPSSTEMSALMGQLRKGEVGYQTPLVPSNSNLSPLVPQQLQQTLSIATSSMADLKLFPMLSKTPVNNTVVEFNRVLRHGAELSPFIQEGGVAPLNRSTYEKVAISIKYLAERREVSDVASFVNLVGPSPDAIAEETRRGTEILLRRLEKELFHGDSSVNSLSWDGIIKQISDGGNVADLRGSAPSAVYLAEILSTLYSAPNYGMVSHILVTPRVLGELIKQTVHAGRHDQIQVQGQSLTFGSSELSITGPYGAVPVIACPFLERHDRIAQPLATSFVFGDGAVTTPTIGVQPTSPAHADSKFVTADEGTYYYRVVPVGSAGVGEAVDTNAVVVTAGDEVTFRIDQTNNTEVDYYKIYRSAKNASNATGALLVGEIKNNGAQTTFSDKNENIAGGSEILFINNAPDYMEYFQMLSLIRRPLAQIRTTHPFLLMMFGAPAVKLPSKMFVIKNAGINASSGLTGVNDRALLGLHV